MLILFGVYLIKPESAQMGTFFILSTVYEPNSAPTNHALSFVRAFSEMGIKAQWVFLLPDLKKSTIDTQFDGITVRYLWKRNLSNNRLQKHLYKHWSFLKFKLSLRKGDVVLLLGMSPYLHSLVALKKIKVFHERTEHPQAVSFFRYKWMEKCYYRACLKADGIFVISNALKEFFESIGVPDKCVNVINMVVDANRFNGIVKHNSVEPYIAYCGKASNTKDGVDDLIKAFAIVSKRHPEVKLYIIGAQPPKESDNRKLVESLGLSDTIYFKGIISANEMPQVLTDAKALALARPNSIQNKYGFPTKLGEYLLTGNPVVVTKVGDIPLFLTDGESALMTECRNIKGFANKLCWAIEHPEESAAIGKRGKIVAEDNFNYLTESKKMINIIFGSEK